MDFSAIVVAAGAGERAGPGLAKQWRPLAGKPVLRWSVEALLDAGARQIVVVIATGDEDLVRRVLTGLGGWSATVGGSTRAQSVIAGLKALEASDTAITLIHDAARPFVGARHVEALIAAVEAGADGAVPALPLGDTLKRIDDLGSSSTVSRSGLWRAQTPQAFRHGVLLAAYAAWPSNEPPTDDAAVVEAAGGRVVLAAGDEILMKLTWPEDFAMAERLLGAVRSTRVGQGFDVHRFGPGEGLWLCGVHIVHSQGLIGHSDADAGLHALTDALLGAIGEGDIGEHFPPSDPQWKGAPSDRFLIHAAALLAARGGRVVSADVTLICEQPKIGPHRLAMRARLAQLLGVDVGQTSVKATTTEGLGFTGRGEGLAAQAIVTVELPA